MRRARAACTACALAACAAAAATRPAHAQGAGALPDPADTLEVTGAARCDGEVVQEIVVYASAPTVARVHRLPVVGPIARSTHVTTRPDIIRGFLLLKEGDACSELARAESERVLRVQPFIADAEIDVVPVDGGVRLDVRTIDEASLLLGARVRSGTPYVTALRAGNSNVGGRGVYLQGEWRDGRATRDGGAIRLTDYQFMGEPYEFQLYANRAPLGGEWHTTLARPFLTGLQRQGWRASGGSMTRYNDLQHPDSQTHAIRFERSYADAGIMGRIGPPVRMGLVGLLVSHERESVSDDLYAFTEEGAPIVVGAHPAPAPYRSTRLNAFVGVRDLRFVRVQGFDALTATQDVPTGYQAGFMAGRGFETPSAGGGKRELFVAGDVYLGGGDSVQATRLQLRGQTVRSREDGRWGRTVATGRFAHQYKPAAHHLLELSADWATAWRSGIPLQLMLGAKEGGVRGHDEERVGGAQRARVSVEHRVVLGNVARVGDLGFAGFFDAGRVWRGDAPFGVTTPTRTSLGISLLAAVPSRSARVWRLDVALPMNGPNARRVEFGLSRGDRTVVFWREPRDVSLLRGRSVPSSVFAWP